MAYTEVTVTGNVLSPNGAGVLGGYIEYELDRVGQVTDGSGNAHVLLGKCRTAISITGAVNFIIISNDDITPANSLYRAKIVPEQGDVFYQTWDVANTPTAQDIGDLAV